MLDFGEQYTRRLPIYLLIDVSESMVGEPLTLVEKGIRQLLDDLRDDPIAVETAYLSVIIFANKAKQIIPLQDILKVNLPHLTVGPGTCLGKAFDLLTEVIQLEVRKTTSTQKGDWKPLIFLMTDGAPTDNWRASFEKFQNALGGTITNFVAVACSEDADLSVLTAVTPNVLAMDSITPDAFKAFFRWVSMSVSTASVGIGSKGKYAHMPLPPDKLRPVTTTVVSPPTNPTQYILSVRCQSTGHVYLMRYRRDTSVKLSYQAVGAYPVGSDYLVEAANRSIDLSIDSSLIAGSVPCPYCGNTGWRVQPDGLAIECFSRVELGRGPAQVVFVLDVTGSMSGEISGVKNGIRNFVDQIGADGLSVEVGLVAFRDLRAGEFPEVLKFDGQSFTSDIDQFKDAVAKLQARGGGGNRCESSFDALLQASRQPFSPDSQRILILITDQPPWLPDGEIREHSDLINALTNATIDQVYVVAPAHVMSDYEFLCNAFDGDMYELGEKGRGSRALSKMLESIGRALRLAIQEG